MLKFQLIDSGQKILPVRNSRKNNRIAQSAKLSSRCSLCLFQPKAFLSAKLVLDIDWLGLGLGLGLG